MVAISGAGVPSRNPARTKNRLKNYFVSRGIQAVCGDLASLTPAVATEIPLGSATVRFLWLRALEAVGRESILARSAFGHPFLCHVGDLAEFPYYHRKAHRRELLVCTEWLNRVEQPVVYDVGANTGFFVTQLAQMARNADPRFYAFEAVPQTFSMLRESIHRLGLDQMIEPVAAAVLDQAATVRLKCCHRNSLLGRVAAENEPLEPADIVTAQAITLDAFCKSAGLAPCLLKIDVEGAEPAVLRGAKDLLTRDRPAILFEYNPGSGYAETTDLLRNGPLDGYVLYYIDDLAGQLLPFGSAVDGLESINWICNLFAVPRECLERWFATIDAAGRRL